ncbi:hypothetical protein ACT453_18700, partial [Bacillus sp. D-CC]
GSVINEGLKDDIVVIVIRNTVFAVSSILNFANLTMQYNIIIFETRYPRIVPSTAPCPPNKCKSGVFTTTLTRIPAAFGLASIAYDAFRMVYVNPEIALGGSQYLISFAPSAILSAIFTVSAAILQGIDYQRKTMIAFSAGILVKVVVNTPLLHLVEQHAP